jgi:GAF domain-containing protein
MIVTDGTKSRSLADLAAALHGTADLPGVARVAVDWIARFLPGTSASIMLSQHRTPVAVAASAPSLRRVDDLQIKLGQGPSLDVLHGATMVQSPDLFMDPKWRPWAEPAVQLGWRSWLSLRMMSRNRNTLGVLNFALAKPDALDPDYIRLAGAVAAHVSVALDITRVRENLMIALDTQAQVGLAVGILMERFEIDGDRAFKVLKRYSQDLHIKLRDVADQLVRSGELPAPPTTASRSGWPA